MSPDRGPQVSAMVLLRGAAEWPADAEVVAANVERLRPAEGTAATAREHFASAGFELGPTVGGAFSISGPPELFQRHFETRIEHAEHGWRAGAGGEELPLSALPGAVAASIRAVGLETPPDFGPPS